MRRALSALIVLAPLAARPAQALRDPVLAAMTAELERSVKILAHAEAVPLYYLNYEITEKRFAHLTASLGAMETDSEGAGRSLDVDARVGSYEEDNTHEIKGQQAWWEERGGRAPMALPLEDDAAALRAALWLQTDAAYKAALERYTKVKTNRAVTAEEEDRSPDFSQGETAEVFSETASFPKIDKDRWRARLRALSARFKEHPFIYDSDVGLSVETDNRWQASSEGARIKTGNTYIRLSYRLSSRTTDGMELSRYNSYDADRMSDLPKDEAVQKDIAASIAELKGLKEAPLVEPFAGPVILRGRAAAVFFHEIFGHRVEGQRQKRESEGQTFTKKLNDKVVSDFISVYDDPTLERFQGEFLRGSYRFDDEGVRSRRVALVEDGILRNFLLNRMPIKGFPRSNGHGRREPGRGTVARMGNLIVEAKRSVPYPELRRRLLEEIARQKKPFGLIFDDIAGGFTMTGRGWMQAFKVMPLVVYKVYPDGRPDELVRGVDIVGTPIAGFMKILAAADDPDVFNGSCGAESGSVPVSAISPSLLISEMEVEKVAKSSAKPPILPPPLFDRVSSGALPKDDRVFSAMKDELDRTMDRLRMEEMPGPYFASYKVRSGLRAQVSASFGALQASRQAPFLEASAVVRVGTYTFDNTNFAGGGFPFFGDPGRGGASYEEDYDNLRFALWSLTDAAYKNALETLAKKKAYKDKRQIAELFDDLSREPAVESYEPPMAETVDLPLWEKRVKELSLVFRDYPEIQSSQVSLGLVAARSRFLTSEGTAVRGSNTSITVNMSASAQAGDGLRLGDGLEVHSPAWADVPSGESLAEEARRLARRVVDAVHGSTVGAYVGPVLFEGEAAAEFFDVFLVDNISSPRGLWSESESSRLYDPPPLAGRLGMRVAAPFLSFVDDPLLERYEGTPLFGHYRIDDEGVPAQRVELIRKGRLADLYMSRSPVRERKRSNGHGRAGAFGPASGRMGNLIVTPDPERAVALEELKAKMRAMCRELELEYGILVRRMAGLSPISAYKVYAEGGREEPLRGIEFVGAGLRPLRDVVAASKELYVFNFQHSMPGRAPVPASIVAPSILVSEMEVKKTERKPDRLPYLRHPYFAEAR